MKKEKIDRAGFVPKDNEKKFYHVLLVTRMHIEREQRYEENERIEPFETNYFPKWQEMSKALGLSEIVILWNPKTQSNPENKKGVKAQEKAEKELLAKEKKLAQEKAEKKQKEDEKIQENFDKEQQEAVEKKKKEDETIQAKAKEKEEKEKKEAELAKESEKFEVILYSEKHSLTRGEMVAYAEKKEFKHNKIIGGAKLAKNLTEHFAEKKEESPEE